jgi:hypothetical protein
MCNYTPPRFWTGEEECSQQRPKKAGVAGEELLLLFFFTLGTLNPEG